MDWRLIAALAGAGVSFCTVAVGAYVVLATSPPRQPTFAAAPTLPSDDRFTVAAAPLLLSVAPSPDQTTPSPFASQDNFTPSISAATSGSAFAPGRADAPLLTVVSPQVADRQIHEPKRETRPGYKAAALTPNDDLRLPEPPARPLVEAKRPSVAPELQAAPPMAHYRGVLTSAEIARIRRNLRLTPEQEPAWPRVEVALAEMGRQQIALIRQGQEPRISSNDWPPGRLYAVAGPLLQTLRPDQKETIRRLCRSLGFESVASLL